ncbi:MAG: hypothetical protein CV087_09890 [Candidatus Brocadia sp. WS118]|nr:MAG: hypothetical protein CV087_09890 [Candidatus Brocadia sp. WS118]
MIGLHICIPRVSRKREAPAIRGKLLGYHVYRFAVGNYTHILIQIRCEHNSVDLLHKKPDFRMNSPAPEGRGGGIKNSYNSFRGFSPTFWQHSWLKPQSVLFGYSLPRAEARGYSIHNPCNLCCAL